MAFELREIEKNGKVYVKDPTDDARYGVRVTPGSEDDNTIGKVGIHWISPRFDMNDPYINEIRGVISILDTSNPKPVVKEIVEVVPLVNEPCPKCHTYCDGDCEA